LEVIERYDLEVFTPPCSPGTVRFCAIARFDVDICAVLPYLNAVLPGARYNPAAGALVWWSDDHEIVFGASQIAVGNLEDRTEAEQVVQAMVAQVNHTWAERATITPDHTAYRRSRPMDVYRLLPRTNCKVCGQPTCFTFALKLIAGQAAPDDCRPLVDSGGVDRLRGALSHR
jgi:ArsR family metal-binding transcriptional regulator